jgi:hypothetical protein
MESLADLLVDVIARRRAPEEAAPLVEAWAGKHQGRLLYTDGDPAEGRG